MGAYKFDHPPLLAPGRHFMTLPEIYELCVRRFEYRERREGLFFALAAFVHRFREADIPREMFIDGSFLTKKQDPSDVDVAVELDHDVANSLTKA